MKIKLTTNKELDLALKDKIPTEADNIKIISILERSEHITLFYPWPPQELTNFLILDKPIRLPEIQKIFLFLKTLKEKDILIIADYDLTIGKALEEWITDLLSPILQIETVVQEEFPPKDEEFKLKLYQFSSGLLTLPEVALKVLNSASTSEELKIVADQYLKDLFINQGLTK